MSFESKVLVWTSLITVVLLIYGVIKPPYEAIEIPEQVKVFISSDRNEIDLIQVNLNL